MYGAVCRGHAHPPLLTYAHYGGSTAVTGGFFYTGSNFPSTYQNRFFFGDYGHGFIRTLQTDANDNLVANSDVHGREHRRLTAGSARVADGYLYYVAINTNELRANPLHRSELAAVGGGPATPTNGLLPLNVSFSSAGTVDPNGRPITYSWDFGDGRALDRSQPEHTYAVTPVPTTHADGHQQRTGPNASRTPSSHRQPAADGAHHLTFRVAAVQGRRHVIFSGSGTDYNGTPDHGMQFDLGDHRPPLPPGFVPHPLLLEATGPAAASLPDHGDDVYLELQLTATNPAGLSTTSASRSTRSWSPSPSTACRLAWSRLRRHERHHPAHPADGPTRSTCCSHLARGSGPAVFASWSDGGAQQHNIVTPANNATYTATFNVNRLPTAASRWTARPATR